MCPFSGLCNAHAQAKGKRLGRPGGDEDAVRIAILRAAGASWRAIAREMGLGMATLYRAVSVAKANSNL